MLNWWPAAFKNSWEAVVTAESAVGVMGVVSCLNNNRERDIVGGDVI